MATTVPSMQELLEAGVHFGHQVRRGHPRMGQYLFGARDGVHIINLEQSEKLLKAACEYVEKLGAEGKILLFIGTKKQAQGIVRVSAQKVGAPYVDYKWMAGLLTNFEELRKNIKKLLDLKAQQEKGELSHYTKKEQLLISRQLEKFELEYGGVIQLEKLPDALYLSDCVTEKTALNEAIRMGIPVIGVADSNSNPERIDYPIPGNDDAAKAITILTEAIANAYGAGLKKVGKGVVQPNNEKNKGEELLDAPVAEEVAVLEEVVEKEELKDSKVEV